MFVSVKFREGDVKTYTYIANEAYAVGDRVLVDVKGEQKVVYVARISRSAWVARRSRSALRDLGLVIRRASRRLDRRAILRRHAGVLGGYRLGGQTCRQAA